MFLPDEAMRTMPEIDFLSRGEGEETVSAIVEALESGDSECPITGVTARTGDGGWLRGAPAAPTEDLDEYPSPWLSGVLDPSEWDESILLTSRGCPCRCAFCITPTASDGAVRFHSVDRVLAEIEWIVRRGSGRLWFADPNFTVDPHRVVELLEGLARRGLRPEMWIETRADLITQELIGLMRQAGVHTVALGLESSSAHVCELVGKNLEPERVRTATFSLLDAGLDVELFSQFALPGETYDDAMQTLAFVRDCGVPIRGNTNAQQMQLYFGSRVCADPASYGVRPLRDDLPAHLSIGSEFETDWMTRDEISRVKTAWRAESLDGGKGIVS
jgi:radical SAM superfamily enzyme YgiQ (UPF0313 family)